MIFILDSLRFLFCHILDHLLFDSGTVTGIIVDRGASADNRIRSVMSRIVVDRGVSANNRIRSIMSRIVVDRGSTASGDSGSETLERDACLAVIVIECYVHWGGETVFGSDEDSRITLFGRV